MTVLTAVAGGGAFMTAATWSPAQQPTAADDCVLAVGSGAVTVDAGSVCRSLNATAYVSTLTHTAGVTLTIGDGTAGAANVALALGAGMTYTLGNVATSAISFVSTSATQQTVATGGKTLGNVSFGGAGSSYLLSSALTIGATATFTLSAGTFNTGGFAMSLGLMVISGATAKVLTLSSSAIAITGNSNTAVNYSGSNLTMTANTAVMTFSGAGAGISGTLNWNGTSAVFNSTVTSVVLTGPTLNNVTYTGPASKTAFLTIGALLLTATGTLTVTGNSAVNRLIMQSSVTGTSRTVTVGTAVSLSNVDFQDITAAGAAGTWTGTSMGNALGNTNITFDASVTQTRTGAGGNWSTAANWTSRVPLPQDNVIVAGAASGTLTADMPRLGADVDFTGFAGTASFASVANSLYGSLTLATGMTVSGTQALTLAARSAKTITSSGKTLTQDVNITAPGGTYTLAGNLSLPTRALSFVRGALFDTAGFAVDASSWVISAPGSDTLTITNSALTLNSTAGTVWNNIGAAAVNANGSTIIITAASASSRTFAGANRTYGTLTYTVAGSTGSLTITGANTFGTINFSDATNARSLLFTAATTTTVTNFNVIGTAGKLMTVDSSTAATHTLTKSTGTVSSDYLSVKNSTATPSSTWYAGANSVDAGGNTGWNFTVPPTGPKLVAQTGRRPLTQAVLY